MELKGWTLRELRRPFFIKQLEGGLIALHRVLNQRRIYLCEFWNLQRSATKNVFLRWTCWPVMLFKQTCMSGMYSQKGLGRMKVNCP
jgi:hypothetical protein